MLSFQELKQRIFEREKSGEAQRSGRALQVFMEIRERSGCPRPEDFDDFHDGTLTLRRNIAIRWHVLWCKFCQMEVYAMRGSGQDSPVSTWVFPRWYIRRILMRHLALAAIVGLIAVYFRYGIMTAIIANFIGVILILVTLWVIAAFWPSRRR